VDSGIPKTRWAKTIDGASIAYQDFGEGATTLVFVVGWVSHIEVLWELPAWERMLRRFAKNMRVLHFDKRGVGMSDRLSAAPGLDVQMDDIRAVMDAAGVQRAALYGQGFVSPALAAFFAASHPDRTVALWLDGLVHFAKDRDYPWGESEADWEQWVKTFCPVWGTLENALPLLRDMMGDIPENESFYADPATQRWAVKYARYSATPTGVEQLGRMWRDTDVRPILPTVCVPTAVVINPALGADRAAVEYVATHIPNCRRIEMDIPGLHVPAVLEHYVCTLEGFIASAQREEAALERRLATVLLTDIVGSTDKACEVGDACWGELLAQHHAVVRAYLSRFRGQEVKTTGDGFLATFDAPARAVKCAEGICRAVKPLGLEVRAGCHTGEIEIMGADVGGLAVHIAARVAAKARPSEVLVSSTVKDLVAGSALAFTDRGNHRLRGVPGSWRLYAVDV
jgi:class 3 adenylate cyclase/pimeloyl-ACP methyl ester carboxylesterase